MVSTTAAPSQGRALRKLTLTETKLLGRNPAVLFWAVGFPLVAIIVLGLVPAANRPVKAFDGLTVLETWLPVSIIFTLVMTSTNFLPTTLVAYRERGVLRRMFTTPVKPRTLLAAQILLNLAVQVATVAVISVLAVAAYGVKVGQPGGFVIAYVLTAAAISSVGLLIAAVCYSSKAANAAGAVLLFVLMFFAGLWIPRAAMPAMLRDISDFTPVGAGGQAIMSAMSGHWAPWWYFVVLVGYIAVCVALAVRMFRWE